MKKTVQIVTIPLAKEGWSKGDIVINELFIPTSNFLIAGNDNPDGANNRVQQLLVLSDDEIQEGSMFFANQGVRKCIRVDEKTSCPYITLQNGEEVGHFKTWHNNIIASYPHIEGTLPISKETVQAWIDAGTPVEGNVEMGQFYDGSYYSKCRECGTNFIGDKRWHTCKECSEKSIKVDPQGNVLLEFSKRQKGRVWTQEEFNEEFNDTEPLYIPTQEEIEEKAEQQYPPLSEHYVGIHVTSLRESYINGYKQALKDLGLCK